jgi:hypothetical protein
MSTAAARKIDLEFFFCSAESAIASRICCFRSRLCAIVLPFGRLELMTDGDSVVPVTVVSALVSLSLSATSCATISLAAIVLKSKEGITSITSKTYMVLN